MTYEYLLESFRVRRRAAFGVAGSVALFVLLAMLVMAL